MDDCIQDEIRFICVTVRTQDSAQLLTKHTD